MRSLFHFPLPCTTTLAVTVSYSNRPTAPEMSRRPHPAPMRRQRRSPVLLSAARPLPGPALTGPRPTVARSQGARHAAPPSLPRAAAVLHVLRFAVRIAPTVRRHPRHPPHLSPRVAAAPGPWPARTAPYASLFRRMREITHGAKMLPAPPGLSPAAACGPAERALRHATAACGTRHGRTGFAPCGAGLACLPHAPPCHLARVHRRCLTRAALRRPRPATRSPHRCISPPARRTHPASRADPPRPGNKRNNANNSMRA